MKKAKKLFRDSPSWSSMQQLEVELPGDPPFSSFPLKNILRFCIQTDFKIAEENILKTSLCNIDIEQANSR